MISQTRQAQPAHGEPAESVPVLIPYRLRRGGALTADTDDRVRQLLEVIRPATLLLAAGRGDEVRPIAQPGSHLQRAAAALVGLMLAVRAGQWPEAARRLGETPQWLWLQFAPVSACLTLLHAAGRAGQAQLQRICRQQPELTAPWDWPPLLLLWVAHGASVDDVIRAAATLQDRFDQAGTPAPELAALTGYLSRNSTPSRDDPADLSFALLDYQHPLRHAGSDNLGDYIQTLAVLVQLARLADVDFTGEQVLMGVLRRVRGMLEPRDLIRTPPRTARLLSLDRDAPRLTPMPPDTWLLAAGWHSHPLVAGYFDFPWPAAVRPILLSWHCAHPDMLTPDACQYLRDHGPVGCRDQASVELLQSRQVPAVFSGCLTSTLGLLGHRHHTTGTPLAVDVPTRHGESTLSHMDVDLRGRPLGQNLGKALDRLLTYRDHAAAIRTSRLHCYLPARAMGCEVHWDGPASGPRLSGLLDLPDSQFAQMAEALNRQCAAVLTRIVAGSS